MMQSLLKILGFTILGFVVGYAVGVFFQLLPMPYGIPPIIFGLILAAIAISLSILIFAKRLIAAAEKEKF